MAIPKKKVATPKAKAKVANTPIESVIEKEPVTVGYEGYAPEVQTKKDIKVSTEPVFEYKDRSYIIATNKTPIVMTIPSRHTQRRNLLWMDENLGYERELRYATNQKSVFADEQEGHVTLAHIIMRDGILHVPKEKVNLQKLLSIYHPLKGKLYKELDNKAEAVDDIEIMDLELEAETAAANMDIDLCESIMRVEIGSAVNNLSSKELRRDCRLMARREPLKFLQLANDENISIRNIGVKAVEKGILKLASDQRTFLWKSTGRKIMVVPFDENPYSALAAYFKTDEGVEVFQSIERLLN